MREGKQATTEFPQEIRPVANGLSAAPASLHTKRQMQATTQIHWASTVVVRHPATPGMPYAIGPAVESTTHQL